MVRQAHHERTKDMYVVHYLCKPQSFRKSRDLAFVVRPGEGADLLPSFGLFCGKAELFANALGQPLADQGLIRDRFRRGDLAQRLNLSWIKFD
jgi:hypothetical protein